MHPQPTKVAIQGDRASFHEIAASEYYQTPIELMYCQSFEEVFSSLVSGKADKAFVAVKNTGHGYIEEVADLLRVNDVVIEGQYDLRLQQHLIGLPNGEMSNIRTIVSHAVALSQCDVYINESLSHTRVQNFHDTAAAVSYVKDLADPATAAIGSEAAARLYGLKIMSRSIQNDPENTTTFQSISRQEVFAGTSY